MSPSNFVVSKHIFRGQHIRHYGGGTRNGEEDVQYLEIKQYKPLHAPEQHRSEITIIGAGAVSFPKEIYEPLWDELYDHCEKHGIRIRSIWMADKSDHGASGILNEHTQGDDPSYSDLARDLLSMVNTFRDDITLPIVGIGHSLGGTALIELSNMHPRLFASLVLIDPIIGPSIKNAGLILINASVRRQDLWSSRQEAEYAFTSSKVFQRWDPRVQNSWLQYGFRDTPTLLHPRTGMVTLRTTKATEAWSYARPWFDPLPAHGSIDTTRSRIKYPDGDSSIVDTHPFYRPEPGMAWDIMPNLHPTVLYLFPASGFVSSPESTKKKVARTGSGTRGSGGEAKGRVEKSL